MYIFISHSSKDAATATELCDIIEANGSDCFLAPRDIRSGYEYAAEIINGIDRSDAILLILSNNAIASPHVLREIERAVSKSIPIIVYKMEEVVLTKSFEYFLMSHQWLDAKCCNREILLKCIKDLENDSTVTVNASTMNISATAPVSKKKNSSTQKNKMIFALLVGASIVLLLGVSLGLALKNSGNNNINSNNTYNIVDNTATNNSQDGTGETTSSNSTEQVSSDNDTAVTNNKVNLGDTVVLGKYNNADISWKVLKLSDDGTEALLISKDILTFKGFDGADSGKYSYTTDTNMTLQTNASGNSAWESSTIRTWLNSDKDYVQYEGQAPTDRSMSDGCNGYDMEAGFLYGFTTQELSVIKETSITTKGNALSSKDTITTKDKVFLLSLDELELFEKAGVSLLAVPTAEAVNNNESSYYKEYCQGVFHTNSCQWWLREPLTTSSTECYQVGHGAKNDENIYTSIACADGYGIRPAITVDLTSGIIKATK